ncbi:unnamed protein product [Urochloa decumbens]|uniref:Protein kinase domain-containing protein n=1 Tax=Urochloa decumbens TaxID=240449 RepID=A0ABC8WJZ7_9POAL
MAMLGRRRYCSCASHGFLLLVLLPFLLLFHHPPVGAGADVPSSQPPLNKTQEAIMMNLLSVVGYRWNTTPNPCNWRGVNCSLSGPGSSFVVKNLTLRGFGIANSSIFSSICPLETLEVLDLSKNSIPSLFDQFFALPCAMSAGLLRLNLSSNKLSGQLGNLSAFSKIEVLDLSFNSFSGIVNTEFKSLPELRSLNLSSNHLEGSVPKSMPLDLEELVLSRNQFSGGIPNDLFQYANLTMLDLSQNNLTGDVANDVGKLTKLEILLLSGNHLNGTIPTTLSALKNLSRFAANQNNFIGMIHSGITKHVKMLDLSYNSLSGTIPSDFLSPAGLEAVDLTSNQIEGQILGNFSRSLYRLRLGSNLLNGSIPNTIGDALGLAYLELDNNTMVGNIPWQLGNCNNLILLNLACNKLEGSVPNDFGNLGKLEVLKLQENSLSGSIPTVFSNLTNLGFLNLSQNAFTGEIPPRLFNLFNLTNVNLQGNKISGLIPSIPTTLTSLLELNLANNSLIGTIPAMPTSLSTALNLSHNHLNGAIPTNIGKLDNLEILDLSYNNLSGSVPSSLTGMNSLTVLVLSYNQLSGHLPSFGSFVSVISYGNPGLTNATTQVSDGSSRRHAHIIIIIIIFSGTFVGTLVLVGVAIYSYSKRIYHVDDRGVPTEDAHAIVNGSMKEKLDYWQIASFQALNFVAADIPQELMEENLIGSGGSGHVYRVTYTNQYNSRTGVVAVKQIQSVGWLNEKLEREFESEVSILCNIRHKNIVKLLCCLSSTESKILVYDYMDNGSLDRWLHCGGLCSGDSMARAQSVQHVRLDWPTRLIVAVGAAQGLCYMHHECSPSIVHRDVKASNILLDSEFKAKIADFGVARMLVRAGEPNTMSGVAGSFGYMAPECAYTRKVDAKVDVYGFGVVLLELTTGKKANDGGEHGSLAQWAEQHYRSGRSIPDAIDTSIRYAGYTDEIETVFRLGVKCTGSSPSSRPTMKDVLQILLKCCQQTLRKSRMESSIEYEADPLLMP